MRTGRFIRHLTIAALAALTFTFGACKSDNPVKPGTDDHADAEGLVILLDTNAVVVVAQGVATGSLSVRTDSSTAPFTVWFVDADGHRFQPDDPLKTIEYEIAATDVAIVAPDAAPWTFRLTGVRPGSATLEIRLMHAAHPDFRTPAIPISVTP